MRWLTNISFSSSSSSSDHHHHRHGGSRLFNIRRNRKQSNLSREDLPSSPSFAETTVSRSSSVTSNRNNDKNKLCPRPHPLPLPKNSSSGGGGDDCPLPSPDDLGGRSSSGFDDFDGVFAVSPISSACAHQEPRKSAEQLDVRLSRSGHQQCVSNGSPRNIPVASAPTSPLGSPRNIPVASAPTSPLGSPVRSPGPPRRVFCKAAPMGNQVWCAAEMSVFDGVPGIPCQSLLNHVTYSNECSPLHSPVGRSLHRNAISAVTSPVHPTLSSGHENSNCTNVRLLLHSPPTRSPCRSPKSGPASPVHPNFSSGHDGFNHANVHPLPLPPGATLPSPSTTSTKSDSTPMQRQWQKGKLIGRGTFGSVYVATNRETGALCAMKEVEMCPDDPKSAECVKQLQQEIKVLSQLQHPNIVQYYGSEIIDDNFYIYLEFVHPGSIDKYVRENCGAITESIVRSFTRHILTGLAYLHSKKTVHRDIKGANLLVDSCGVVKLADFGMAKHLNGHLANLSLKGSPYWMAPELMQSVMQKDKSSDLAYAVDIWSLGCTIIEMLTGKPPWSEYEGAAAMFKVMRETPPIPNTVSPEGKDFLQLCFLRNPAERPPANVLLEHPFLRGSMQADGPLVDQASYKLVQGEQCSHRSDNVPTYSSAQFKKGETNSDSPGKQCRYGLEDVSKPSSAPYIGSRHSPRSTLDALSCLSPNMGYSTNQ